ncbi:GAF domain-containing protein [Paraburkholderia sp. Tr-20389]|nr:GAF domain-containing protein [Paraburkholderia sp. Tr-20389]
MTAPATLNVQYAQAHRRMTELNTQNLVDTFEADAHACAAGPEQDQGIQAVSRISEALASHDKPERLMEILLRAALESAGAGQGALVLLRSGVWQLSASAQMINGSIVVKQEPGPFTRHLLPVSLVHAVARTREGVAMDDAHASPAYAQDAYLRSKCPRSVLCLPLTRASTLVGVLYLENTEVRGAFTAAKQALLKVIASQAAFALETARLHEELVEQNQQRARTEEQLRSALADLDRASRLNAMGELVASIVHEVGQPLAAVDTSAIAALRWLNRSPPDIDEARAMLTHIGVSAARARGIIHSMRAKARKAEPQFATLDLCNALREASALVAVQLDALKVSLELRGLNGCMQVRGDRIQLQQVVINLLMNGAESMAARDSDRRLVLACSIQDDVVCVTVDDLGSGIAPEIAHRLHEPLFTTKESGMGMGLAISHSIVDAHGGKLTLSAREGVGTRATFTLPRLGY